MPGRLALLISGHGGVIVDAEIQMALIFKWSVYGLRVTVTRTNSILDHHPVFLVRLVRFSVLPFH